LRANTSAPGRTKRRGWQRSVLGATAGGRELLNSIGIDTFVTDVAAALN
jgi:hypothetical protein